MYVVSFFALIFYVDAIVCVQFELRISGVNVLFLLSV